jgi:hypothetical protein
MLRANLKTGPGVSGSLKSSTLKDYFTDARRYNNNVFNVALSRYLEFGTA